MSPSDWMMYMFGFASLGLLLFQLGCRNIEKERVEVDPPIDLDADGYNRDEDCDDGNSSVYPGAVEACDGVDNNCDGNIDEGVLGLFYIDEDGDGFGDNAQSFSSCEAQPGYVSVGNDCDDGTTDIYPGAVEICDGVDNDCDEQIDEELAQGWFLDTDEDGYGNPNQPLLDCLLGTEGYIDNDLDCDDEAPQTHTGAIEICDEQDNDCDGVIDEQEGSASLWFLDADEDGYGDAGSSVPSCAQPDGYVANSDDCDDNDALQNPNGQEVCNAEDDNCDGLVDVDASDPNTFYQDADSDGYGDSINTAQSCNQPLGYVANNLDCNDANPQISPVSTERCNAIDDNCNGIVDDYALGSAVYYIDADEDGYGTGSGTSSCTALSGYVLNNLDCNDADPTQSPLGIEICNAEDDNCNGSVDEFATDALTWYLDDDGDGYGLVTQWALSCTLPAGYSAYNTDCDDTDANISPEATEDCNEIDDNCNNQIDEGLSIPQWYYDDDGDGFGSPVTAVEACTIPSGMVDNGADCDDTESAVNPQADEICQDGIDNNCDGDIDDASAIDAFSGYLDLDGDGYGGGSLESSCDDIYESTDADCNDSDPAISPDASEDCDGIDNDCDGIIDSAAICPCDLSHFDDSAYLFCTNNRTWSVAKGECAQYGYHLVSIDDSTEDGWLDTQIDAYPSNVWWIGYNDLTVEDYWDWDGPFSSYENWGAQQPSGAGDCVQLNAQSGGVWSDASCASSIYFVCEANP